MNFFYRAAKLTFGCMMLGTLLFAVPVSIGHAQSPLDEATKNLNDSATGLKGAGAQKTLPQIVGSLIDTFLSLLGIILLGYIIYGGYQWMTAQGDTKKIDAGRQTIQNAVIGIVIVLSAYIISTFVITELRNATTNKAPAAAAPAE